MRLETLPTGLPRYPKVDYTIRIASPTMMDVSVWSWVRIRDKVEGKYVVQKVEQWVRIPIAPNHNNIREIMFAQQQFHWHCFASPLYQGAEGVDRDPNHKEVGYWLDPFQEDVVDVKKMYKYVSNT